MTGRGARRGRALLVVRLVGVLAAPAAAAAARHACGRAASDRSRQTRPSAQGVFGRGGRPKHAYAQVGVLLFCGLGRAISAFLRVEQTAEGA
eukprot:962698-Alexandrium_andersonii.AAC.1